MFENLGWGFLCRELPNRLVRTLVLPCLLALLTSCGGGGGESAPIAAGLVVGAGTDLTTVSIRSGSEVVLNGENSDGIRFPIATAVWRQTDSTGIVVQLDKRTELTRAFRVPDVDVPTKLTFELKITNRDGDVTTKNVEVNIVPVGDSDKFLEFFRSLDGNYTVVAALAAGVTTTSDVVFTVTQRQLVNYADRTSTSSTPNQLGVQLQAVETGSSRWLSGTSAVWTTIDEATKAFYHPNLAFRIPRLDIDEINVLFDDSDADRGVAEHKRDTVEQFVDLRLQVTSGTCAQAGTPVDCQQVATLYVRKSDGTLVDNPGGTSATHRVVSVDTLKAINPSAGAVTAPESALTAQKYYEAVDPDDKRTTLNDWLENSGFITASGAFIDESQYARTLYVNNYDLGFTRDMFLRTDAATGNVYAYVTNYPALRAQIVRSTDPARRDDDVLATVAMEFAPPDQDPSAPKIVKFFVYVPDGDGEQPRVRSLNFDGRGEKWVPGACAPCHGGQLRDLEPVDPMNPASELVYPGHGNIDAGFLPWDLDSFLFVRAQNPALVDPVVTEGFKINSGYLTEADLDRFSRENQEEAFRKMNEGALATMDPNAPSDRFDVVRDMIHGWYGEEDDTGNTLPDISFVGGYIQNGWRATDSMNASVPGLEAFYQDVFARHCRVCHSQAKDINQFASWDNFKAAQATIQQFVFQDGVMPNARLDLDRLWVDFHGAAVPPAQRIVDILGIDPAFASGPGKPIARIEGSSLQTLAPLSAMAGIAPLAVTLTADNLDSIRFDATDSSFVQRFNWQMTGRPAGSNAVLIGADTALPAFRADKAGMYEVTLTGSRTLSNGTVLNATEVVTVDARPLAPKIAAGLVTLNVLESTPDETTTAVIGTTNLQWLDEDTTADNLVFTVTRVPTRGTLSMTTFTQQDIDDGLVTYTEGLPGLASSPTDSFEYTVVDDGANSVPGQELTFNVTLRNDRPVQVVSGPLVNVLEGGTGVVNTATLRWADEDDPTSAVQFTVVTTPVNGVLTNGGSALGVGDTFTQFDVDSGSVVYDHGDTSEVLTDSFAYAVTDGQTTPGLTGAVSVVITAIDDTPQLAAGRSFQISAGRDRALTGGLNTTSFPAGDVAVIDADTTVASDITLTLTNVPDVGTLEDRTGAPVTIGLNGTFTLQDVISGDVFYVHDGVDLYNADTDAFTLRVSDAVGGVNTATVAINVLARTDGPAPGGDLQTALPSYIDNADARDGASRASTATPDWESVVLTTGDLNFTDGGLGSGPAECAIRYRLSQVPAFGRVRRGLTTIVASTTFAGAASNQIFTQAEVAGGQISYENQTIGDGTAANDPDSPADLADTFRFVASDCVLESPPPGGVAHTFTVTRGFAPALDLGWVIDSIWTDATGTAGTCTDRGCRNCHVTAVTSVCGLVATPAWTSSHAANGTLQYCNLLARYSLANPLPDEPTTAGHGGGVVIQPESFPHDMLRQWEAENFPLPGGVTCP